MWQYRTADELYHYGILGMKWGRHKGKSSRTSTKKSKRQMSDDAKTVKALKKKKVSEMSNEELRKVNQRDELVSKYKKANPNTIKTGLAIVGATAGTLGSIMAIRNNGKELLKIGKTFMDAYMKS